MAENKTQRTKASVAQFIAAIEPEQKRADAKALDRMLRDITSERPALWGPSIVGYGQYHYKYQSGREGDMPKIGFSPRKANLVLYIMPGFKPDAPLLKKLGKYKIGAACLYVNKLADVDTSVLRELAARAWALMGEKYG